MNSYVINPLIERLDVIEEALGEKALSDARYRLEQQKADACACGNHVWTQVGYDYQGGKWGTDQCIHCGKQETWNA